MEYICIRACTFRDRLWIPGEPLVSEPKTEKVPRHFKQKKDLEPREKKRLEETPKTLYEIQREQAKEEAKVIEAQEEASKKKEKSILKDKEDSKEKKNKEVLAKRKDEDKKALEAVGHSQDFLK